MMDLSQKLAALLKRPARPADVPEGATRVRVLTPHGEATVAVEPTEDVAPGVAVLPAGWDTLDANRLLGPCALDPISGFPAFRSGVAAVSKA